MAAISNYVNNEEVFGVVCCCVCKVCILYKKKVRGEERPLGTKNTLDHLKRCLLAPASAHVSLFNWVTSGSVGHPGQWY